MKLPSFRSRSRSPQKEAKLAKMSSFGSPEKDASVVRMPSFGKSSSTQQEGKLARMPSFGNLISPQKDAKKTSSAETQVESYLATAEVAIRHTVDDSMKDLETIALRDAEKREREAREQFWSACEYKPIQTELTADAIQTENLAREAAHLRALNAKRIGFFVSLMVVVGLAVAFHWLLDIAAPAVEAPPRRQVWLR